MRCYWLLVLVGSFVGALLAAPTASPRTLRVATSGGDYDSLSVALFAAISGDTVLIEPGSYFEDWGGPEVVLSERKLDLTVLGNRLDPASVTLSGFRLWFRECDGLLVEGIRFFRNPGAIVVDGRRATITDCIFEENGGRYECGAASTSGRTSDGIVLTHCVFVRNRGQNPLCSGAGVDASGAGVVIEDCLFYDNWSPVMGGAVDSQADVTLIRGCTFLSNRAANGAAVAYRFGDFTMEGCTAWNNYVTGPAGGAAIYLAANSFTVRTSIIARTRNGRAVRCDDWGIIECCDLWANELGTTYGACIREPEQFNIEEDPLFCDEASGDVGLMVGSPCLRETPCGTIGAFGAGCGRTPVRETTWGMLKHKYSAPPRQ